MISEEYLKENFGIKQYDNVLWEYDSELIQIIDMKKEKDKEVFNLSFNNITNKYDIMIVLKNEEKNGYCNCNKGKEGKKCDHLIWSYLKINEIKKQEIKLNNEKQEENFSLSMLEKVIEYTNNKNELEFKVHIDNFSNENVNVEFYASIKGKRKYKITNIEKFIKEVKLEKKLNYGKELNVTSYNVNSHIMNMLLKIEYIILLSKTQEQTFDMNKINYKYLTLLLQDMKNQYITYKDDEYFILNNINDIELFLKKIDNQIKLYINNFKNYKIYENILINDSTKTIYILSKKDIKKLDIINHFKNEKLENGLHEIKVPKEDEEPLMNEIIPKIFNDFDINVDSKLNIEIIENKLKVELFCYLENKQIYIKPIFLYGTYDAQKVYKGKIIKRDLAHENQLINLLLTYGYDYDPYTHEFSIQAQRSQFIFLTKQLSELKKQYEILLDDDLKKAILNFDSSSISINISKNKKYDYFELNIDVDNVVIDDLEEILESFEKKRVFHKLSNDRFLKLNDDNIYNQLLFLKEVIKDNTYKLNSYRIPEYKAILLQEEVKGKFQKYNFNQEFLNYVERIKLIQPLEEEKFKSKEYVLREYQKEGVNWLNNLYEAKLGALLADEMGLGKTIQVISFLKIKKITNSIIVVPKALIYNWKKEFDKFYNEMNIILIEGDKTKREELINAHDGKSILLTTYPSIVNDYKLYKDIDFDTVVIDEAQYIKNPQTKTSRCTKMLKAKFFIALTGTPIENSLLELWSIFDYLLPGYYGDLNDFSKKYKVKEEIRNLDILKNTTAPFIKRRLKKDVLKELPDKIETNIYCEMEEKQKVIYAEYRNKIVDVIQGYVNDGSFNKKSIEMLAAITRLRQLAIEPGLFIPSYNETSGKMSVFEELITEILENKEKVLVFSQYTSLLIKLKSRLEEKEIDYFYLDGKTRPRQRLMDVERFNKTKIPVYLISLKAGGVGLNLTSATNVIIMDPWWNPAVENQAVDRSHRIGQENKVQVHRIISKDTIEEEIQKLKEDKLKLIENVLENEGQDITKLKTKDIINLLGVK